MITILKSTDTGLEPTQELADGCWVRLVDPNPDEIGHISQHFGIPIDFLTSPLDLDESARVEKENGALLIVLRVPHFEGDESDTPYTTAPLGIVLTDRVILTVTKISTGIQDEVVSARTRGLNTTKRSRFFLLLFLSAAKKFLRHLREIDRRVERLEDQLQMSLRNREVLELLKYQKSLTFFTTALRSNGLMMARLQRGSLFQMYPEDEDLLDDVLTEINQAIEMTSISSGILSQMMDAFASIISNNLNSVMKFLASITIVLALPTLVASIYGMNLSLPLGGHPQAFWIIMGLSVVLAAGVVVVFYRQDWL